MARQSPAAFGTRKRAAPNHSRGRPSRLSPIAKHVRAALMPGLLLGLQPGAAWAGPQGGQVVAGQGSIARPDAATTVIHQQSQNLALDWQSFNVQSHELVQFNQPGRDAQALNRIFDQHPSQIFGRLNANGRVVLANPNGVFFGPTARVNVNSLVAAGMQIEVDDFMAGRFKLEALPDADGVVVNQGVIEAATGGDVTLAGKAVRNEGLIVASAGRVNLAAGNRVTLDFDGDGLMRFTVDEAVVENAASLDAAVGNSGSIEADGGEVLITASVAKDVFTNSINNTGLIKAGRIERSGGHIRLVGMGPQASVLNSGTIDASSSGSDHAGTVELRADGSTRISGTGRVLARADDAGAGGTVHVLGGQVALEDAATIDVSGAHGGGTALIGGDYQGRNPAVPNATTTTVAAGATVTADATDRGAGGTVVVWSDGTTVFDGSISARGGEHGGDGGFAEVSGKEHIVLRGFADLRAPAGKAGHLLVDPATVNVCHLGNSCVITQIGPDTISDDHINTQLGLGDFSILTSAASGADGMNDDIVFVDNNVAINWADNLFSLSASRHLTLAGTLTGTGTATLDLKFGQGGIGGTLSFGNATVAVPTITAAGGAGTDTIVGPNAGNTWTTTAAGSGTLAFSAQTVSFTATENLTGGGGVDDFTIGHVFGAIDGAGGNDIFTINADPGTTITGGPGNDIFTINANLANAVQGGAGNDTFIIGGAGIDVTGGIDGGTETDQVVGPAAANTWNITAANAANLTGGPVFTNVEILTGGALADIFNIAVDWAGTLNGGGGADRFLFADGAVVGGSVNGGAGNDDIDWLAYTTERSVTLTAAGGDGFAGLEASIGGGFTGIDQLTSSGSGAGTDTLAAGTSGNVWIIGGGIDNETDDGTITFNSATLTFINFANLTGGPGIDGFTFNGSGSLTGLLDGGGAATDNTLTISDADAVANTWNLSGVNQGAVVGTVAGFSNIGHLVGDGDDDIFDLDEGESVAGSIDGMGGSNTIDWAGYNVSAVNVTFSAGVDAGAATGVTGGFRNIATLIGGTSGNPDTLSGADQIAEWELDADPRYCEPDCAAPARAIGFSGFENYTGGAAVDTFTVAASQGGTLTGGGGSDRFVLADGVTVAAIDGGAGIDTLDLAGFAAGRAFVIDANDGGSVTGVVTTFASIGNLTGSATGGDSFTFTVDGAALSGAIAGGGGSDTVNWSGYTSGVGVSLTGLGATDGFDSTAATGLAGGFTDIDVLVGGGAVPDTLTGRDQIAEWELDADPRYCEPDCAAPARAIAFSAFEHLTGGSMADRFNISAAHAGILSGGAGDDTFAFIGGNAVVLTGTIDGGGQILQDTIDLSSSTANPTIRLVTQGGNIGQGEVNPHILNGGEAPGSKDDFQGIEKIIGGALQADDGFDHVWIITGLNTGTLDGIAFENSGALIGGDRADTFTIQSGGQLGGAIGIDGSTQLAVNDKIIAGAAATVVFSGADQGTITIAGLSTTFRNIESFDGSSGSDVFRFNNGSSISGRIDGKGAGADNDEIDYSALAAGIAVTLGPDIVDIETLRGGDAGGAGTLFTLAGGNVWDLTGPNSGTVDGIAFVDWGNLSGIAGSDDTFTLSGGSLSGTIDGLGNAGGGDRIRGAALGLIFNVTGGNAGNIAGGVTVGGFTRIENLTGSTTDDSFVITGSLSGLIAGNGGMDTADWSGAAGTTVTLGSDVTDVDILIGGDAGGAGNAFTLAGGNLFTVTTPNSGTVDGIVFMDWGNLSGIAASSDTFTITSTLSGRIDGVSGADDVADWSGAAGLTVTLGTDVVNVDRVIGGDGGGAGNAFTLAGGNAFDLTGPNSGTVDGIVFTDWGNLSGIAGNDDTFTLTGGSLSGAIDGVSGGGGGDRIQGAATGLIFNVTGSNAGDVAGGVAVASFTNVQRLIGSTADDTFNVTTGTLSGRIDGNGSTGADIVDYSGGAPRTVTLGTEVTNVDEIRGNGAGFELAGGTAWTLSGGVNGTVDGIAFTNWQRLTGSAGADTFTITGNHSAILDGGDGSDVFIFTGAFTLDGAIDGGAAGGPADTIDFSASTLFQEVSVAGGTNHGSAGTIEGVGPDLGTDLVSGGFDNIDVITGNGLGQLIGPPGDTWWVINGLNSGTFGPSQAQESTNTFNNFFVLGQGGADRFRFTAAGELTGGLDGGGGVNTVVGTSTASLFILGSPSSGVIDPDNVAGSDTTFVNITNLETGTFRLQTTNAWGGAVSDGTIEFVISDHDVTIDTLDASGADGSSAGIGGGFTNITRITNPNSGMATLTLADAALAAPVWTLNGVADDGDIDGNFSFVQFDNLNGGPNADTFNINGVHSGTLLGNAGGDAFVFADGAVLDGSIGGGTGVDHINWIAYTTDRSVTLTGADAVNGFGGTEASIAGGFSGIDQLTSSSSAAATDTLTAATSANDWAIGAGVGNETDDGTIASNAATLTFIDFANLIGGGLDDAFVFSTPAARVTGRIDGGTGGTDTLSFAGGPAAVVTLTGLGASNGFSGTEPATIGTFFTNINRLIGSSNIDELHGRDVVALWTLDGTSYTEAVSMRSLIFDDTVENLFGGALADTFTITVSRAGNIDGGDGANVFNVGGTGTTVTGNLVGGAGADTFNIGGSGATVTGNVIGNGGDDTFNLGGSATVVVGDLIGGDGDDAFNFANDASITGRVVGGLHVLGDRLDWSSSSRAVSLAFANLAALDAGDLTPIVGSGFTGIENFTTNNALSTFAAPDTDNTWTIDGVNSFTIDTGAVIRSFSGFGNVTGGTGADAFRFTGLGRLDGGLDGGGGAGANTLTANDIANAWTVTGARSGTVTGLGAAGFTNIDLIRGGTAADTVTVIGAAAFAGTIDGGAGINTIVGGNVANTWNLLGVGAGNIGGANGFVGMSNLTGGSAADTFRFNDGAAFVNVNAGAGSDVLDFSPATGPVSFNLATRTETARGFISGLASNFEALTGTGAADRLVGEDNPNSWNLTANNTGSVDGLVFSSFENLIGGADTDSFVLNGHSVTGTSGVVGGGGLDSLIQAGSNTWTLTGANAGSVDGTVFALVENLVGTGAAANTLDFAGGSLSGVFTAPLIALVDVAIANGGPLSLSGNVTAGNVTFSNPVILLGGASTAPVTFTAGSLVFNGALGIHGHVLLTSTTNTTAFNGQVTSPTRATSLTILPSSLSDIFIDTAAGAGHIRSTSFSGFLGHLVIGAQLADTSVRAERTRIVDPPGTLADRITVGGDFTSGGDVTFLASNFDLLADVTAGDARAPGQITILALGDTQGSGSPEGDITGPASGSAALRGNRAVLIANNTIVNDENIRLDLNGGELLVAVSSGQAEPTFDPGSNAISIDFDPAALRLIAELANPIGVQAVQVVFVNPAAALTGLQNVQFIDIGLFEEELSLFGVIGNGIALSLDQCEEVEGCAPNVTEEELDRLIATLEARIAELERRASQSDDARIESVLAGYRRELENFLSYRAQLRDYLEAEEDFGDDFEEFDELEFEQEELELAPEAAEPGPGAPDVAPAPAAPADRTEDLEEPDIEPDLEPLAPPGDIEEPPPADFEELEIEPGEFEELEEELDESLIEGLIEPAFVNQRRGLAFLGGSGEVHWAGDIVLPAPHRRY